MKKNKLYTVGINYPANKFDTGGSTNTMGISPENTKGELAGKGIAAGLAFAGSVTNDITNNLSAYEQMKKGDKGLWENAMSPYNPSSTNAFMADWNNRVLPKKVTRSDIYNSSNDPWWSMLKQPLEGATAGTMVLPGWGTLIGAVAGTVTGAATAGVAEAEAQNYIKRHNSIVNKMNDRDSSNSTNAINNINLDQGLNSALNYAAFGGELNTQGADFTNGMLYINEGGTHEENPNEGVPMGVDPEGTPNLVEEGETIYNDYVFSNRIKVPKAVRNKYKLRGCKGLTFADASKKLAKESEERPHDPISQRGLQAALSDLAMSQEYIKQMQQQQEQEAMMANYAALGGGIGKFEDGGSIDYYGPEWTNVQVGDKGYSIATPSLSQEHRDYLQGLIDNGLYEAAGSQVIDWRKNGVYADGGKVNRFGGGSVMQTVDYNNSTPGLYFGLSKDLFNPYLEDNSINWDVMYGTTSPYTLRRNYVINNWDNDDVKEWRQKYIEGVNSYNANRPDYTPIDWNDLTLDQFKERTSDKHWGGFHAGVDYAGDIGTPVNRASRYWLRTKGDDDKYTVTPLPDKYSGVNEETHQTWEDAIDRKNLIPVNEGRGTVREPVDVDGVSTIYTDYYFDPKKVGDKEGGKEQGIDLTPEESKKLRKAEWLRYAPAIGSGLMVASDLFGLTNKPKYTEANAMLEAAEAAQRVPHIGFRPVGNYLTYKPFDRNYWANRSMQQANATRRAIMNSANPGRYAAMLNADYNAQMGLGELYRQGEEYNFNRRKDVEEFNRETNKINSAGFLEADKANQSADLEGMKESLNAKLYANKLKYDERVAAEDARAANISNLFDNIGDIGRDNVNINARNYLITSGAYGPITDDNRYLLTGQKSPEMKEAAKKRKAEEERTRSRNQNKQELMTKIDKSSKRTLKHIYKQEKKEGVIPRDQRYRDYIVEASSLDRSRKRSKEEKARRRTGKKYLTIE